MKPTAKPNPPKQPAKPIAKGKLSSGDAARIRAKASRILGSGAGAAY